MGSTERSPVGFRRWVLAAYWVFIYFLTHWPSFDRLAQGITWPSDKEVHTGMYAGWAFLWWWVLSGAYKRVSRGAVVWLVVGAAAYGIFDELTQAIVGRDPDVIDFACDMLGAGGVLAILYLWQSRPWVGRAGVERLRA